MMMLKYLAKCNIHIRRDHSYCYSSNNNRFILKNWRLAHLSHFRPWFSSFLATCHLPLEQLSFFSVPSIFHWLFDVFMVLIFVIFSGYLTFIITRDQVLLSKCLITPELLLLSLALAKYFHFFLALSDRRASSRVTRLGAPMTTFQHFGTLILATQQCLQF